MGGFDLKVAFQIHAIVFLWVGCFGHRIDGKSSAIGEIKRGRHQVRLCGTAGYDGPRVVVIGLDRLSTGCGHIRFLPSNNSIWNQRFRAV